MILHIAYVYKRLVKPKVAKVKTPLDNNSK